VRLQVLSKDVRLHPQPTIVPRGPANDATGTSGIKTRRKTSRRVPIVELAGQAPGAPAKPDQPLRRSQRGDSAC